jgi:hypothetical protein
MTELKSRRGLLALFGGLAAAAVVSTLPTSAEAGQAPVAPVLPTEPDAEGQYRRWGRRRPWRRPMRRRVCRTRFDRWGRPVRVCRFY